MDTNLNGQTPSIKPAYRFLFDNTLQQNFFLDARVFAIIAMIDSGFVAEKQLIEAVEDQLNRSTVTVLLVEACDEGLLRFKKMITRERHYSLTEKGRHALNAFITLAPMMRTGNLMLIPPKQSSIKPD